MGAVLALIGLPIAFAITMLFLMTTSEHTISPVLGVGLIAGLMAFFVGILRCVRRLEPGN